MKLTVVGSGDAFNGGGRGHSCYRVDHDGSAVMVDFGATALEGLKRLGHSPAELDALLFTHLHGDHIGGFPFLVIDALFVAPRDRPLQLVGPIGLEAKLMTLLDVAYGRDILTKGAPLELEFHELAPGEGWTLGAALALETFAADHMDPPEQPLCLRLRSPEHAIAFSGDTQPCPGLLQALDGAALGVVECSALAPPAGRHCTWEDWRRIAPTLDRTERLLFSHLGAAVRAAADQLLQTAPERGPELGFADDGQIVELRSPVYPAATPV